jgi:antitoxin VapB
MPLNIKNPKVEKLIADVARMTGENKTEAVRRALEERKARLVYHAVSDDRGSRLRSFLSREVWPTIPRKALGRELSKDEEERILGYREHGV